MQSHGFNCRALLPPLLIPCFLGPQVREQCSSPAAGAHSGGANTGPNAGPAPASHVVPHPVLVTTRDHPNPWHNMEQLTTVFQALSAINLPEWQRRGLQVRACVDIAGGPLGKQWQPLPRNDPFCCMHACMYHERHTCRLHSADAFVYHDGKKQLLVPSCFQRSGIAIPWLVLHFNCFGGA